MALEGIRVVGTSGGRERRGKGRRESDEKKNRFDKALLARLGDEPPEEEEDPAAASEGTLAEHDADSPDPGRPGARIDVVA
ncbi:MAG: hypothetical protein ACYTGB_05610 [Planctomycetota bacterium]|jgi:hypothetical protein